MSPRRKHPWPDRGLLQGLGLRVLHDDSGAEYNRLLALIRAGELQADPTLILFSSDGIIHFSRADLIPWFYCSTERVEELLRWFVTEGFPKDAP